MIPFFNRKKEVKSKEIDSIIVFTICASLAMFFKSSPKLLRLFGELKGKQNNPFITEYYDYIEAMIQDDDNVIIKKTIDFIQKRSIFKLSKFTSGSKELSSLVVHSVMIVLKTAVVPTVYLLLKEVFTQASFDSLSLIYHVEITKTSLFMDLTNEQEICVKVVLSGSNVFVTGSAGVGESYLIQYLRNMKKTTVLSFTGTSSLAINGQTLHSFFELSPKYEKFEQYIGDVVLRYNEARMMFSSDEFRNPDCRWALLRRGRRISHDSFRRNYLNSVFVEKKDNNTTNESLPLEPGVKKHLGLSAPSSPTKKPNLKEIRKAVAHNGRTSLHSLRHPSFYQIELFLPRLHQVKRTTSSWKRIKSRMKRDR